jgi:hypothetical protein
MKIADCLAFCGDRGAYFIGLMDIAVEYKTLFLQIVRSLNVFLLKAPQKADLEKANVNLVCSNAYVLPFYLTFYRLILPFNVLRCIVLSYLLPFYLTFCNITFIDLYFS